MSLYENVMLDSYAEPPDAFAVEHMAARHCRPLLFHEERLEADAALEGGHSGLDFKAVAENKTS